MILWRRALTPALRINFPAAPRGGRDLVRLRRVRTVKEFKFFRKQAEKAERMAQAASDAEISKNFLSMAKAYRAQASVLKAKERPKAKKKSGLVDNRTNGRLP
jgi:hypothetical protein